MRTASLLLALASLALLSLAQDGPVFKADFTNPGLVPSHWVLTIRPDGSSHFHSERGNPPARANASTTDPPEVDPPNVDRDIHLSAAFAAHVFQIARSSPFSRGDCESHAKVAFQGWKKLTVSGPETETVCAFNYSKEKQIQGLGDSLVSVANTILEGAKLEALLQYDRLGLDRETEYMLDGVKDGRMQQLCTIRGILQRLAGDETVMGRVRKRAQLLLAKSGE